LFACLCLLSFLQCGKNGGPLSMLPPATTEGKNKMGFIVDGKLWLPYWPCPREIGGGPSCGEAGVGYHGAGKLAMHFGRLIESGESYLTVTTKSDGIITTTGNFINAINVGFKAENGNWPDGHYAGPLPGSSFKITRMDTVNNIVSGEFELILAEQNSSGNKIHLKAGRFDFKIGDCLCSD